MYHHLFGFVSQDLAEQAKVKVSTLSYVKEAKVLNLSISWTMDFSTDSTLDTSVQHDLIEQLHPMIPSFNIEYK